MNFIYLESSSLYPSIFYHFSGVWLRGQQPKQGSPDFSLPNYFVQLFPVWLFSVRRRSRDSILSSGTRQTVAQNTPFDEEGHCGGRPLWGQAAMASTWCPVLCLQGPAGHSSKRQHGIPLPWAHGLQEGSGALCVGWEPKAESHSVSIKITLCYLKLWFSQHQHLGGTKGCWQKYAFKELL